MQIWYCQRVFYMNFGKLVEKRVPSWKSAVRDVRLSFLLP